MRFFINVVKTITNHNVFKTKKGRYRPQYIRYISKIYFYSVSNSFLISSKATFRSTVLAPVTLALMFLVSE